jgi:alpha-N-arabinofuranosidase
MMNTDRNTWSDKRMIVRVLFAIFFGSSPVWATDFHVARDGKDSNTGSEASPFYSIQHAADIAQPGDVITVHQGVYRERINPPRGGESDSRRITYQSFPGDKVEIKGSEVVVGWEKVQDDTWKVVLRNSFFSGFNPYSDLLRGDWFNPLGRKHHSGAVYDHGDWLAEATTLEELLKPVEKTPLWFAQVDKEITTIWAQFPNGNPNERQVEINVRRTVFYPNKPGRNYITVRGFTMSHAATPWAPPTAEQIGLIGTHWSKGWIIENNTISHSTCSGITLGKYGDGFDNKSNSADAYNKTIERALINGWNKETIGHHLVRNNNISHCEQAGIVGSLGAVFSAISNNSIHDIHVRRLFTGCEQAGIKLHAAIDVLINHNHIYRCNRGLWLDWMAQGTQVTDNLLHDNASDKVDWPKKWEANLPGGEQDIFLEVNHGPILIANNLLLSPYSINSRSQGVTFAHNLIAGAMRIVPLDGRLTPWHEPHATKVMGLKNHPMGDNRYYNNIFVNRADLRGYDKATSPLWMDGNVFLQGAKPSVHESNPLVLPEFASAIQVVEKPDGWWLEFTLDKSWTNLRTRKLVTSELLGLAAIPNMAFENPDGSPIRINTDYFGNQRNDANPAPGPFEKLESGKQEIKIYVPVFRGDQGQQLMTGEARLSDRVQ